MSSVSQRAPRPQGVLSGEDGGGGPQGDALDQVLRAIVAPPSACPGCVAAQGQPWPAGTTSRYCTPCISRMRRVYQVQRWNADHAHQVAAGHASFAAFSARWRAGSGLPPLSSEAVRLYVTPDGIRGPLGILLPERVRQLLYRSWCAGQLVNVADWLDNAPPDPEGLWVAPTPEA